MAGCNSGDEKKAATGKQIVMYAVIGLILIGLSAVIANSVIAIVLGSSQLNL
jgi:hypothetical protein